MSEDALFLTTLDCSGCGNKTTYAHEGEWVPLDQEPPWPSDVEVCPACGHEYSDDLAVDVVEVAEAECVQNPEDQDSQQLTEREVIDELGGGASMEDLDDG